MDPAQLLAVISVLALPVLFAVTLHEAAHGYVARMLGDDTAERAGRISINPLRHVDLFGTVLRCIGIDTEKLTSVSLTPQGDIIEELL